MYKWIVNYVNVCEYVLDQFSPWAHSHLVSSVCGIGSGFTTIQTRGKKRLLTMNEGIDGFESVTVYRVHINVLDKIATMWVCLRGI